MKPGLGRIVHYKTLDGFVFAAMLIHVEAESTKVNLIYWDALGNQRFIEAAEQIPGPMEDGQTGWFYPKMDPAQAEEFRVKMAQMQADIRSVINQRGGPRPMQTPFNAPRVAGPRVPPDRDAT